MTTITLREFATPAVLQTYLAANPCSRVAARIIRQSSAPDARWYALEHSESPDACRLAGMVADQEDRHARREYAKAAKRGNGKDAQSRALRRIARYHANEELAKLKEALTTYNGIG